MLLGRLVVSQLDTLAVANSDDFNWSFSQIEVELLRAQRAGLRAYYEPDLDLSTFRRRYDIFHSRVSILTGSALLRALRENPENETSVKAAVDFLDRTDPIVDGPDEVLRASLPTILEELEDVRERLRVLSITGVQDHVDLEAHQREALSDTLVKLAVLLFALILALILTIAWLFRQFQLAERAAHAIQVAQARFEAVARSSLDAIVVADTTGHVVEFNGAAEKVFGYTRNEVLGRDLADLIVPPAMRDMHRKAMKRYLETGEARIIGTGRVRMEAMRKSGKLFPVELSVSLAEARGEIVFVSFVRDITSELAAEDQLRAARDKAQESEKAKSDLLTVMSHEMRTPLNGILGSLSLIKPDNLTSRQKRHLKSIEVSGGLLLSHVNDVLDLSRSASDIPLRSRTRFDLRKTVANVAESLSANAEARGNALEVRFLNEGAAWVSGFETALQQCLVNLFGNAIKFTADGLVAIEVERLPDETFVEFRVSDTGAGIAEEDLGRIFNEFVTVDTAFTRENAGTGLGLAITQRLVTAMQGEIDVDSIPGEGSQFLLRLPLPAVDGPGKPRADRSGKDQADFAGRLAALVVDDNEVNRMILTDMLNDLGIRAVDACDGHDALRIFARQRFDLVLMDISMPGIDGIETLERMRAMDVEWRGVPSIAVTAHASKADQTTIMRADFADLLVKPITLKDVRSAITDLLDEDALSRPHGAARDFRERFGDARYAKALADLSRDADDLVDTLRGAETLEKAVTEKVHRLSGGAAVLGKQKLWERLQAIENCDPGRWREHRSELIADLSAAVEKLRATQP